MSQAGEVDQTTPTRRAGPSEIDRLNLSLANEGIKTSATDSRESNCVRHLDEFRFSLTDTPSLNHFVCQWMLLHPSRKAGKRRIN